jgi:hypothetical protein
MVEFTVMCNHATRMVWACICEIFESICQISQVLNSSKQPAMSEFTAHYNMLRAARGLNEQADELYNSGGAVATTSQRSTNLPNSVNKINKNRDGLGCTYVMAARAIAQVHLHFFSFSLRVPGAASDDAAAPPAPPRDSPRGAARTRATRPPRACDAREQSEIEAAANNSSKLQSKHWHAQRSFRIRRGREQQRRQAQRQRQRLQWGEGAIWTCCLCGCGCGGDGSSSSWQRRHQRQHQERQQRQQEPQQREEQGGRQSCDGGLHGRVDLRGLKSREQTQIKRRKIARGRGHRGAQGAVPRQQRHRAEFGGETR